MAAPREVQRNLLRGARRVSEGAAKKEEKPRKFQAIRGTRDLLPPETGLWNRVEHTAHKVFATFGFGEIRPPIFEPTELFARSIGLETDVVSKEMYTFRDPTEELDKILINALRFAEEKGITFGIGSDNVETPAKVQRILSEQPLL